MRRGFLAILLTTAVPALAVDLSLPGGTQVAQQESAADSVRPPESAWQPGVAFTETEGAVRRTVYQVPNAAMTTLQLIDPLRTALAQAGYEEVFTCADKACGGFDFRFQLDLLPAPEMFVDLGNYRYLLMKHAENDPRAVSLVASASTDAGYLHVTEVSSFESFAPPVVEPEAAPAPATLPPDLITTLVETGHVVLADLEFATGSADLSDGPYQSLQTLADWLAATPAARVVLVGHTDSVGSLDENLALSRQRARSVQNRLTGRFGVNVSQIASDGAGALSPIAPNLTAEGRASNRRVEVVLLSIE